MTTRIYMCLRAEEEEEEKNTISFLRSLNTIEICSTFRDNILHLTELKVELWVLLNQYRIRSMSTK